LPATRTVKKGAHLLTRPKPWRLDDYTQREKCQVLCYSGSTKGQYAWQKGAEVECGEFSRDEPFSPIQQSLFYATATHHCETPERAQARAVEIAGFRKPFGVAPDSWRIAHWRLATALERYDGLDAFLLSMRENVRFYGGLSPRQLKAVSRMKFKLKEFLPPE
jgi:hypothetical protein